jgi:hypothetical protein
MVRSRYGEFKVLVDGGPVIDAGALAALGVTRSSLITESAKTQQSRR